MKGAGPKRRQQIEIPTPPKTMNGLRSQG